MGRFRILKFTRLLSRHAFTISPQLFSIARRSFYFHIPDRPDVPDIDHPDHRDRKKRLSGDTGQYHDKRPQFLKSILFDIGRYILLPMILMNASCQL